MNLPMLRLSGLKIAVAAGLALCACSSAARATVTLTVTSGATTDSVTDNLTGDIDPNTGAIIFDQAVGSFSTNINAGVSADGTLELQTIDVRNNSDGPQIITITLTDNAKTAAGLPRTLSSTGNGTFAAAPTGDMVTFQSTANSTSTPAQVAVSPGGPLSPFVFPLETVPFLDSGTFTLSEKLTIKASAGATVNVDGVGTVVGTVPEPASAGLLALLGASALLRKRRA